MRFSEESKPVSGTRTSDGLAGWQPLRARVVLSTGNIDELTKVGSELFSPHRLSFQGDNALLSSARINGISLIAMRYCGESKVATTQELGYYAVHLPILGRGRVAFDRDIVQTTHGAGVVFNPVDMPAMHWSADMYQLAVKIPVQTLERHLSLLTGQPVRRRLVFMHTAGQIVAGSWAESVKVLAGAVDKHRSQRMHDALGTRLEDMFLTALLLSQPNNWSEWLYEGATPAAPRAVQLAVELIEAEPEYPWTVARLAEEVGSSIRSLQEGFRRSKEITPMEYVRLTRLARVHRRLNDPLFSGMSVSDIAFDAGFTHPGRFAAMYYRKYGVLPSVARGRPE